MKQCIKCKQQIPDDAMFCVECGQLQSINENDEERGNTFNAENTEKKKRKKQWKIAGIVFGAGVLLFVLVLRLASCSTPKTKPYSSSNSYSYTEPTTVDNSVNGMGYYNFDNSMEDAIEKYRNIVDETSESTLENTIDNITVDKFDIDYISMFLDSERVTGYIYNYYNGDTAICLHINDAGEVVAASYMYTSALLSGFKYEKEAMGEQLICKPAKWLYALSDDLTYDNALEIYKTLYLEHLDAVTEAEEGKEDVIAHYYNGYTILVNNSSSTESITILKTDSDFIEKKNIKAGQPSIFQPIDTGTDENRESTDMKGSDTLSGSTAATTYETSKSNTATVTGTHHAEIEIEDYGAISVELNADIAPITVQNFINLANDGFYDGLTFHRIIEGFMMQGGDPLGTGMGGSENTIKGEFANNGVTNNLSHTRGAISMARSSAYDSASSQFFIVHKDSTFLDGEYAVFGYVTDGMDIIDEICIKTPVVPNSNGTVEAANQPVIKTIKIID